MNENFEEYRDLVQLMRAAPKVSVADGFTERILIGLPDSNPWLRRAAYMRHRLFYRDAHAREGGSSVCLDPRECSFYFFITSFFYLVVGMVLMAGFRIGSGTAAAAWIGLQSLVTLGTAIWLFALGAALMAQGRAIATPARMGTLLFILATIANGVMIGQDLNIPHASVLLIGFVGGGVSMGVMLALAVKRMELGLR
jgi:hypothetical protein